MKMNGRKQGLVYGFLLFLTLALIGLTGCEPPSSDDQCTYDIENYDAVASARVFYPCDMEENNDLYNAVTLSGGFSNVKEQMYWIAEHLRDEGYIVFAISARLNISVAGYTNAHTSALELMDRENSDPRSPVYGRIGQKALIGYSMGGGGVLNVAADVGNDIAAVLALAPFNPERNLRDLEAPAIMIVGQNDSIAPKSFSENAYDNIPNSTTKCLIELENFGHLKWMNNNDSSGDTPKLLIADWLDLHMNGNTSKIVTFTTPPREVVVNENNL